MSYNCKIPILIVAYNRPDALLRVLQAVKRIYPSKLYFAVDGLREDDTNNIEKNKTVKRIIDDIDWCENIRKKYRMNNVGCKTNVSTAIDWVFDNENELIILEDDLLPSQSFFRFCETMLEYYRGNKRVYQICGYNVLQECKHDKSYYFTNFPVISGWATWKDKWISYDPMMINMSNKNIKNKIYSLYKKRRHGRFQYNRFNNLYKLFRKGKGDSWAYPWAFTIAYNEGVSVMPTKNLVSNIGFGEDAHNNGKTTSPFAKPYAVDIDFPLKHPKEICVDRDADTKTLEVHYLNGHPYWYAYLSQIYRRFVLNGDSKLISYLKKIVNEKCGF